MTIPGLWNLGFDNVSYIINHCKPNFKTNLGFNMEDSKRTRWQIWGFFLDFWTRLDHQHTLKKKETQIWAAWFNQHPDIWSILLFCKCFICTYTVVRCEKKVDIRNTSWHIKRRSPLTSPAWHAKIVWWSIKYVVTPSALLKRFETIPSQDAKPICKSCVTGYPFWELEDLESSSSAL